MNSESPCAGTLPNPAESIRGKFSSEQLHSFEFAESWPVGIEVMFPPNTGFAEMEHVFIFHAMHPVNNGMADLRLQFADKAIKGTHLENGHETQSLQNPALAGNDVERVVKDVKTSIRPAFAVKMMYSQFAPPSASWSEARQC
jgi:hypothetical protein